MAIYYIFDCYMLDCLLQTLVFVTYLIVYYILNKKESLHFLDRNLPNLIQTHYFKKYAYIKDDKTTMQKSFEVD